MTCIAPRRLAGFCRKDSTFTTIKVRTIRPDFFNDNWLLQGFGTGGTKGRVYNVNIRPVHNLTDVSKVHPEVRRKEKSQTFNT